MTNIINLQKTIKLLAEAQGIATGLFLTVNDNEYLEQHLKTIWTNIDEALNILCEKEPK